MTEPSRRAGRPFLAFCASLFCPGLGHFLIGHAGRGLFWLSAIMGANLVCAALFMNPLSVQAMLIALAVNAGLALIMLGDAFLLGRRRMHTRPGGALKRYVGGLMFLALLLVIQPGRRAAKYFRSKYVQAFLIRGQSMTPTLQEQDQVLVRKGADIRRFDQVLIDAPPGETNSPLVKRVVGLPGETIEIRGGGLRVNHRKIQLPEGIDSYLSMDRPSGRPGNGCQGNPIHLSKGEYYVLGDNAERSMDSRLWERRYKGSQRGAVPAAHIVGRLTAVYWPVDRWKTLPR